MSVDKIRNQFAYKVWGRYALFSDPITRMGGEKLSYPIPTYQALKGITESLYWKPSIHYVIDEVCVMNPIRMESKNIRPISYEQPQNTLSVYTYLVDPVYLVRAHFIANPYRTEPDLIADGQNEHKHHNIVRRMIQGGATSFWARGSARAMLSPATLTRKRSAVTTRIAERLISA